MVRDQALDRVDRHQLALVDQVLQQLGVVDDLEVAAELRVLVRDGVEAVRAGGHDPLLRGVLQRGVERLDVLRAEHLEEELVAQAAGRVTGAGLLLAQDGELDSRRCAAVRRRPWWSSSPGPPTHRRSRPVEVLDLGKLDVLADHRHLDAGLLLQLLDPVQPGLGRHAPRIALVLQVLEHRPGLGRERGLDHHLVAAHVDDVVDVLDVHRALLDAGAAGGAGPQHVGVDDPVLFRGADQRALGLGQRGRRDVLQLLRSTGLVAFGILAAMRPAGTAPWRRRAPAGS